MAALKWAHGNTLRDLTFAEYSYDALGRRINKKLYSTTYDRREPMVWDNNEDYYYTGQQVAEVRNGSGQTERIFIFGTQYVDEPICMAVNSDPQTDGDCFDEDDERYFYHQDANYNVVGLTDKTGWAVEHYEYDPYGQVRIHRGRIFEDSDQAYWTVADHSPSANPFTFTGRWLDDESGLMHYRARPYSPSLGRFVTQDPMGALATVPTEPVNRDGGCAEVHTLSVGGG